MRRSPGFAAPALLALSVALAIGPGALTWAASASVPVKVSGPSPYATCTTGGVSGTPATHINYPNAEVEPYVAVNPTTFGTGHLNMVGVWQQDRWSDGGAHALMAAYTVDGGATWQETSLPFASCADPGSDYQIASDPWVTFGPDGRAYVSALVVGFNGSGVQAATSSDGGKTWNNLRTVKNDGNINMNDKEAITADPVKPGTAYLVWDRTENSANSAWFSQTTDGGQTWSTPKRVVPLDWTDDFTLSNEIVVDPRSGSLYDVYFASIERPVYKTTCRKVKNKKTGKTTKKCTKKRVLAKSPIRDVTLSFVKSTDGGGTWSKPQPIVALAGWKDPQFKEDIIRSGNPLPSATVDPRTGTLYVAWADGRWSGGDHEDASLISSSDGGQHWSNPVQVDPPGDKPVFDVSAAVNSAGVVGVTYDRVAPGPRSAASLPAEFWFQTSADGGKTFGPGTRVAGPFDMRGAPQTDGGLFLGDYQGLAPAGASFESFFIMTTGNSQNPTDLYVAGLTP